MHEYSLARHLLDRVGVDARSRCSSPAVTRDGIGAWIAWLERRRIGP